MGQTIEELIEIAQQTGELDLSNRGLTEVPERIRELRGLRVLILGDLYFFKGDMNTLQTEVNAIGKRLDTQEFINRSVLVGLILAVLAGILQIFLPRLSG